MEAIIQFAQNIPVWLYQAGAGAMLLILFFVVALLLRRNRFQKRLADFLSIPGQKDPGDYFTKKELLSHTRAIERLAEERGAEVVSELGVDQLWTERLKERERPQDFRRILRFAPAQGLFACFLVALRNSKFASGLKSYLEENNDFLVLRRLALSGRGEDFVGSDARDFFSERLDEIREMTGDPEWPSRYFAIKILLYDDQERSIRAVWDSFKDPYPLVRKSVASEIHTREEERLYGELRDLLLHDPVFEVREAARSRIKRDLPSWYDLDAKELEPEEALHVVELLDPESEQDINAALEFLGGDDLELRLAAARFLEKAGTLGRLLVQADLGDRELFDRNSDLLEKAAEVNVTGFLASLHETQGVAPLLMGARLLRSSGDPGQIADLGERVFRLYRGDTPNYAELYEVAVECIRLRGEAEAQKLLAQELRSAREDEKLLSVALRGVSKGHDTIFGKELFALLEDPEFPCREELRGAICQLDPSAVLRECLGIISSGREKHAHRVRIDALRLLGELELPYALQDILEHLPILPLDEAREFTALLNAHDSKLLERKAKRLLESVDGSVRASLIAALPATGKKAFLNEIKKALEDADPDVRIAATWSLVEYDETRALTQAAEMLRDPLERVRLNVARAVGQSGGKAALDKLKETLFDENEVNAVKRAAIQGLVAAQTPKSTDMLVDKLEEDKELQQELKEGLSHSTESATMKRLIERFKDGSPALRDAITEVFKLMGEHSEEAIREVLEEDIPSLRPFLNEILESTGYVESRIRMLNHRDPKVRRDAADFLSAVGTASAFRGIVLAARDPDEEVRVKVTKALERLATKDGEQILHTLEEDPERRIRKYTHWALERIKAKKL
ncbi:MAG: HEAT repeat domain-containing protein [Spirochaetaceae bacterium]